MSERKSRAWKPKLTAKQQAHVDALDVEIGRNVSLLQALRKQVGLSQAELASILKTSQSNVSKLEGGRQVPIDVYRRLIEAKGGTLEVVAKIDGKELVLPV